VNKPTLIISLDFELHWGRFDKYSIDSNLTYYRNTRAVIPKLLALFSKYDIHVTWATVGMLMAETREEWEFYSPEFKPSYTNRLFSAYSWMDSQSQVVNEALFAPELVKLILETPNQELGSHSYSHYYSLADGQRVEEWGADLEAANRIALEKFNHTHYSLVFPRNQYSEISLNLAQKKGFKAVRTNPLDWFWANSQQESLLKKVFRTGDTLFPLGVRSSYGVVGCKKEMATLPASRLLRPYSEGSLFNQRRVDRVKGEIDQAISFGEIYHLWWHPHNFGHYPDENLRILEDLLGWIKDRMETKGLKSMTMQEAAEKCK